MKDDYIRQHYVWRYYLKSWAKNGQIWCLRDHKPFKASLMKVAQEKYFYKTNELNENEINLIMRMISSFPKENHSLLYDTFIVYLASSNGTEYLQKNGIEIFHGIVEQRAMTALTEINKCGDLSILEDEDTKIDFSKFVARQYSRTKKVKFRTSFVTDNIPLPDEYAGKCDVSKIMSVFSFLTSESIGNWIYSNSKIYLLKNETEIKFITSDQPVFNIKSNGYEIATEIELFYPIKPDRALLFSIRDDVNEKLSTTDIENYNFMIKEQSHEILFATSKEEIECITKK